MSKLILVDGSSYMHRAFHALPPLTNSEGKPTGALYGCINMLKKLLKEEEYDNFAVVIDYPSKNFRHQLFPAYKASRKSLPEELIYQLKVFPELIEALGIPLLSESGVEADDVIATLTKQGLKQGYEVLIVSSDKDLMQLVNEKVIIYDTMNNLRLDINRVYEKFGVYPEQMVDYLTLIGDTSDGVPGVEKVGPKTAVKWLTEFKTLDNLFLHQGEIKGKVGETLREAFSQHLSVSKQLITLKDDLNLNLTVDDLVLKPSSPKLKKLYRYFNFKNWLQEEESVTIPPLSEDLNLLASASSFAFYWINSDEVAFATDSAIFIIKDYSLIKKYLYQSAAQKILFDLKKTSNFFKEGLPSHLIDIKLGTYLLDSTQSELDLKSLAKEKLNWIPKDSVQMVWAILQIYQTTTLKEKVLDLLVNLEQPLSVVLRKMEQKGILVDMNFYKKTAENFAQEIDQIVDEIFELVPHFNLNSPSQLQKILYEKLGLPILQKTPKGQPSTSEDALESLKNNHPVILLILTYRELAKLKSTYLDPLPLLLDEERRLHTTFHQTMTVTSRLSSSNPNLQNIPIRTEKGRLLRKLFIAPSGKLLLSADYSQIELRIMAHLSKDASMIEIFKQDLDLHAIVAREIFSKFSPEIGRQKAKAINFGLIYGMSSFGLAKRLDLSVGEAKNYINFYFERFPGVKNYMEEIQKEAKQNGFVTSILGRCFYLPDLYVRNFQRRSAAERLAINAGLQGSAAEIIKMAMIKLDKELHIFPGVDLLLQIHDELVWEIPIELKEKLIPTIKTSMESVFSLAVPLKVNVVTGNSWEEAH